VKGKLDELGEEEEKGKLSRKGRGKGGGKGPGKRRGGTFFHKTIYPKDRGEQILASDRWSTG